MLEFLKNLRTLLSKGWCQGSMAVDKDGKPTGVFLTNACSWCLMGGICKLTPYDSPFNARLREEVHSYLNKFLPLGIVHFNDNSTYWEVLDFLDKRIEELSHE